MARYRITVGKLKAEGQWWVDGGFNPKFGALLECPFDDCSRGYSTSNHKTESKAKNDVRDKLIAHIKMSHN